MCKCGCGVRVGYYIAIRKKEPKHVKETASDSSPGGGVDPLLDSSAPVVDPLLRAMQEDGLVE